MKNRFFPVVLVALLTVACGSSTPDRPAGVAKPDIAVQMQGPSIFFGSGYTAPVALDIMVTNNASVPLRVRRVQIESPSMVEYTIRPFTRIYNEELGPGQSKTLSVVATAYTNISRLNPSEPLQLRAIVEFEGPNRTRFREIIFQRAA
ncbi:MAG: hypothetical protein JOZ54_19125 [Acidobacteria bacterium]|nr:hypothetical protein [Acidobacteriota bacterium]